MSAVLEHMIKPGNEEMTEVEIRKILRRPTSDGTEISYNSRIFVEYKKGDVLYTAGRPLPKYYDSDEGKRHLGWYKRTDDDNVVREWLRATGDTPEEVEKELDEMKNGPASLRNVLKISGCTQAQIEEEIQRRWVEGEYNIGPQVIPIGYRKEEIKDDEIYRHPIWREIYNRISNIPLIDDVRVSRCGDLEAVCYNLGLRMSPAECQVLRGTYLEIAKEVGFNPEFPQHPDPSNRLTFNYRENLFQSISFSSFGDISPLTIFMFIPHGLDGVRFLKKFEDNIASFNPKTGDFSQPIQVRV